MSRGSAGRRSKTVLFLLTLLAGLTFKYIRLKYNLFCKNYDCSVLFCFNKLVSIRLVLHMRGLIVDAKIIEKKT